VSTLRWLSPAEIASVCVLSSSKLCRQQPVTSRRCDLRATAGVYHHHIVTRFVRWSSIQVLSRGYCGLKAPVSRSMLAAASCLGAGGEHSFAPIRTLRNLTLNLTRCFVLTHARMHVTALGRRCTATLSSRLPATMRSTGSRTDGCTPAA
jgi:hypothetical protein